MHTRFHKHDLLSFGFGEHAIVFDSPQGTGDNPAVMLGFARVCLALPADTLVADVNFTHNSCKKVEG